MLETKRLRLRPLSMADADDLLEYHGDDLVVRYIPWEPRTLSSVRAAIEQYLTLPMVLDREGDSIVLGWELKASGKIVGQSNATLLSLRDRTADVGWVTNRHFWRQGLAFEATQAFQDHLLTLPNVHRLVANIDTRNPGSARLAEKLGMRLEGEFKQAAYTKGEWCDMWIYALLENG
jgi:aminoglycoside 6'-N-acetyltransferase